MYGPQNSSLQIVGFTVLHHCGYANKKCWRGTVKRSGGRTRWESFLQLNSFNLHSKVQRYYKGGLFSLYVHIISSFLQQNILILRKIRKDLRFRNLENFKRSLIKIFFVNNFHIKTTIFWNFCFLGKISFFKREWKT